MLVIKIELHNANTGLVSEIGRMIIANDGTGTAETGNYDVKIARLTQLGAKQTNHMLWANPLAKARVTGFPRWKANIWDLVGRACEALETWDLESDL